MNPIVKNLKDSIEKISNADLEAAFVAIANEAERRVARQRSIDAFDATEKAIKFEAAQKAKGERMNALFAKQFEQRYGK